MLEIVTLSSLPMKTSTGKSGEWFRLKLNEYE